MHLAKCSLTSLPEELGCRRSLEELDISYNDIKELPFNLHRATSLWLICVTKVPLKFPFSQYVDRSTYEIHGLSLQKLKQLLSDVALGSEKWPQLKLVTLGHGSAGKVFPCYLNEVIDYFNTRFAPGN